MKSVDKNVLKWNFIFQYGYVVTNIINALVLLPFYVSYIDEYELGLWLATGNILAWLTMTDPGIGDILQQKIAELNGKKEQHEISKTIGSGIISSLITFIISIILGTVLYIFLGKIIGINLDKYENLQFAFYISILSTGLSLVTFSLAGINQGLLNAKGVAKSYISSNILYLIVNLIFLFLEYGVMSIAIANITRSLYLVVYNSFEIRKQTKKNQIIYNTSHFKKFIRVFSYTSISKVITSISNNLDLMLLSRYIPVNLITVFEINRRPIKMAQGLIGRYSVALMPNISHLLSDKNELKRIIKKQFNIYLKLIILFSILFALCYKDLISAWTDESKYSGNFILILLILNFFVALIGYFMSNMTFALGDIKFNSLINGIKGVIVVISMYLGAKNGGIEGVLLASLATSFFIDFLLFTFRLMKLDYFSITIPRSILLTWLKFSGLIIIFTTGIMYISNQIPDQNHFFKLIFNGGLFTLCFIITIIVTEKEIKAFLLSKIKK